jgi:glycosyltransferase 2 family protein
MDRQLVPAAATGAPASLTRGAVVRWLIGLAVSAVFMWLAFRAVNPAEVWRGIASANQLLLIPAVFANLVVSVLRSFRWKLCFDRRDPLTLPQASVAYAAGTLSGQTVVPARLGDLVRVYVLGRVSAASSSRALGTLVIERLADLFAVVIVLALLLPLFSLPAWVKAADGFAAGLGAIGLVVVYLLAQRSEQLEEPAWVAGRRLPHLAFGVLLKVLQGFSAVRDPRRGLLVLATSFAVWLLQTVPYGIAFAALHLPLGWKEAALTTVVLALTAIIPTGPGFAGSFEIATQQLLAIFAVDRAAAIGYQEYTRIINLLGVVLFMAVALLALRLSRSDNTPDLAAV